MVYINENNLKHFFQNSNSKPFTKSQKLLSKPIFPRSKIKKIDFGSLVQSKHDK